MRWQQLLWKGIVAVGGLVALLLVSVEFTYAQKRGGSFGGSRSSSRSYSIPRSAPPSSFGGSRMYTPPRATAPSSFGRVRPQEPITPFAPSRVAVPRAVGTPLPSAESYRRSYGIPRRQEVRTISTPAGPQNAIIHSYGGYADGLLMGYLMGQTSWLWFTPFHPAFYFTQPYHVSRPDGTVEYYPPTFSLSKLLFVLIVLAAIGFIVWVIIRNRRLQRGLIGTGTLSRSSFGG
ncbi:MAG: hypothetical protein RML15_07485 [Bacteroidota bacterium]|nr:hypothetical protein [Candidatus Kapabacteria bacterium]MDW8075818.1 hypothetical protein [Bacteroidota bacterium]MDW8272235.1 hypothetical protein [Bacteroidota bacterium]